MRTNKREIAFYAEDGEGTYNELVIDFYNRYYEYNRETKEKFLYGRGGAVPEIKISREEIFKIMDVIEPLFDGEEGIGTYITKAEQEKMDSGKPDFNSEMLWKALKHELTQKEINEISSFDYSYEKGDYYDYQLLCAEINNCINGKISFDDFMDWLALMMHCLMSNNISDKAIKFEYEQLADLIDGFMFVNIDLLDYDYLSNRQQGIICRELLAQVKWINHKIEDLRQGQNTDFSTNNVITYVTFAFCLDDGRSSIFKVCVVDKTRWRINYMYIKQFDYNKNINYTFLSEAEFEDLSLKYIRSFKPDPAMSADYAASARKS